jgi:predicted Zn-dependent peptidase
VYAECECPNATEVAKIIAADLRRTCSYQYTQVEIDEALNFILTSDLLDKQEMHALAMQAALDELYGFGYDFRSRYERMLRQVKPADLCRVAQKYLSGGMVMTVVTPQPELLEKGLACPAVHLLKKVTK